MTIKSKKAISIIVALIAVCVIASVFVIKSIKKNAEIDGYLNKSPDLYGEMKIITDSVKVDKNRHSLAGIKEAIRLGADIVTLDICFDNEANPVVCEDYDDITEQTLRLEEVLKMLNSKEEYSNISVNLRFNQLAALDNLNVLLSVYKFESKALISGIDKNRYALISGDDTPAGVFYDYEINGELEDAVNDIVLTTMEYNNAGIVIDSDDLSEQLIEALVKNKISFIVKNADSEIELYRALSYGAYLIETDSPEKLNDIYSNWIETAMDKMDKSIASSLKQ